MTAVIIFFLLLLQCSSIASQSFNPGPKRSIRCDGPLPDFGVPMLEGWDPSQSSLQEICALQAYGGYDPANVGRNSRNLNFFCLGAHFGLTRAHHPLGLPQVAYYPSGRFSILNNPRLRLLCRDRCYCDRWDNPQGPPLLEKPYDVPLSSRVDLVHLGVNTLVHRPDLRSRVYEVRVEDRDDYTNPERHHSSESSPVLAARIASAILSQAHIERGPDSSIFLPMAHNKYVTLNQLNMINCARERVPSYLQPPAPYDGPYIFHLVQDFCANAFSGGDAGANTGAYCDNTPTEHGVDIRQVFFSDDLTPRVEWTWSGNVNWAARSRFFCWTKCWCAGQARPILKPGAGMWRVLDSLDIFGIRNGNGNVMLHSDYDGRSINLPVRGPSSDTSRITPTSTNCLVEGVEICKAWPADLLGPKPIRPPIPTSKIEKEQLMRGSLTCGAECNDSAAKSCAGFEDVDSCQCVRVGDALITFLGLDPVAPPLARCLSIIAIAYFQKLNKGHNKRSLLAEDPDSINDEENDQDDNWKAEAWDEKLECHCNATFVDTRCCDNPLGLV